MIKGNKAIPGKKACIFAGLSGFVLSLFLTVTVFLLLGMHWTMSDTLHDRIVTDSRVLEEQMNSLHEKVKELSQEFGFDPDKVMEEITPEDLQNANLSASHWLTEFFREGKMGETPSFSVGNLEDALREDENFVATQDPYMLKNTILRISGEVDRSLSEKAMLFREPMLRAAERAIGKTIHLPTLISEIRQVTLLSGLASLALAGLIALLTSRRMMLSLRYIGAAMMACGMLLLLGTGLAYLLDLGTLLREISLLAERRFRLLRVYALVDTVITAGLMLLMGKLSMRAGRSVLK